jgi:hypothetical protein
VLDAPAAAPAPPTHHAAAIAADLPLRLKLFSAVTRQGADMRHLDPELTAECLVFFLLNSAHLSESRDG